MSNNITINLDDEDIETASAGAPGAIVDEDGVSASPDIVDEDVNPLDALPARAVRNDDGSVTLPLLYPQTIQTRKDGKVRERHFRELTFHRLNGADQRAIAAATEANLSVVAFSRSTRINQAIMNALYDRLDAADIASGGRVLNHFLTSGPTTGR